VSEKKIEIKNATITAVGWDRERGLTHYITVEGDGWGCSIGGYFLGGECAYEWIIALMDALELCAFNDSDLIGKVVRVKTEGLGGRMLAIGHPIKDKWLEPKKLFQKYNGKDDDT